MTTNKKRFSLILCCLSFFLFGTSIAAIGPTLSELSNVAGTSLAAMGAIFTSIFAGSLVTQFFLGPLTDKFGQQRVLWISMIIMGLGILGYSNIHIFWLMLVFAFIGGIGQGGVDISANVITSNLFADKSTSVLNLLHFFFGFGGLTGPALVSLSIRTIGIARLVLWICAVILIISAAFVYFLRIRLNPATIAQSNADTSWKDVYRSPLIWMIGLLLLLHVGIENGLGGWVTTYLQRTTKISIETAALSTSIFWGSITVGRLAGIFIGKRFSNIQFLVYSLIGSLIGGVLYILTNGLILPTLLSIGVIGFTMGAVYPTVMSVVSLTYPQNPGSAISLSASLGSVGGMLIPLGHGYILEEISPVASTWYVAVIFLILVFIIYTITRMMKSAPVTNAIQDF